MYYDKRTSQLFSKLFSFFLVLHFSLVTKRKLLVQLLEVLLAQLVQVMVPLPFAKK